MGGARRGVGGRYPGLVGVLVVRSQEGGNGTYHK